MRFDIITIFPNAFKSYLGESLIRRALQKKIIDIRIHDLRRFAKDKHKKVDDAPFGGGPGMVLKVEPVHRAVNKIVSICGGRTSKKLEGRIILFSARGKKLDSKTAKRLSKYKQLILICGRYEGVDERVAEHIADEEISIGDYILSGGELPALVLVEAVSRFLPGFLGKRESLEEIKGSYPVYTRPEVFTPNAKRRKPGAKNQRSKVRAWRVPKVLISGDHQKIDEWRRKHGAHDKSSRG